MQVTNKFDYHTVKYSTTTEILNDRTSNSAVVLNGICQIILLIDSTTHK